MELNVALDTEIAAGHMAPIVVIAAAHSANRNSECGAHAVRPAAGAPLPPR
jgi:hypothetical protein